MLGVDDCSIILKYWNIRTSQYTNLTVCVEQNSRLCLSLSLSLSPAEATAMLVENPKKSPASMVYPIYILLLGLGTFSSY